MNQPAARFNENCDGFRRHRSRLGKALAICAMSLAAIILSNQTNAKDSAVPRPTSPADPIRFVTPTGVRVIVQPDSNGDTVAICLFVRAGAAEEEGASGVGLLTSRALFGSNYQHSGEAVRREIYAAGGSLDNRWTPDYTVFTCVTTKSEFPDAVNLLATAVKSADFDPESLDRARREVTPDILKESTDPFRFAYAALRARLYSDGSYRLPIGGTEETVRRLSAASVRRYFARRYTPQNTVVSVAGNVSLDAVKRAMENQFVDYDRPSARPVESADRYSEPSRITRTIPSTTTLLLAGFRAPALSDPDYPAVMVLEALLGGGKSSRLFRQVRDVGGVGYAVGTYFPALAGPGHLIAYLEYDPARDRKPTAADTGTSSSATSEGPTAGEKLLLETIQSVANSSPDAASVERAKRYAAGTYVLAHQRTRDRAFYPGWYETMGVGYALDQDLTRRIDSVTMEDVGRVAKKYLANPVVVIVGPAAPRN